MNSPEMLIKYYPSLIPNSLHETAFSWLLLSKRAVHSRVYRNICRVLSVEEFHRRHWRAEKSILCPASHRNNCANNSSPIVPLLSSFCAIFSHRDPNFPVYAMIQTWFSPFKKVSERHESRWISSSNQISFVVALHLIATMDLPRQENGIRSNWPFLSSRYGRTIL